MHTAFAPAKLNLCLHVTGQREDGYHLLDSIVAFCGIGDQVTVAHAPGDQASLALTGPFGETLRAEPDNLVLRGARHVAPGVGLALGLEKHLPPASGIGGGSADAAAAVRAVAALTGAPLPEARDLAVLGADVPVCLASRPARMRGIGEIVEPLAEFPSGHVVLVNPRVEVPTPAVFRALASRQNPGLPDALPSWPDMASLAAWLAGQRNDLEPAAIVVAPVIATVLAQLRGLEDVLLARMSGSGATCLALFETAAAAKAAAARMRGASPEWWVASGPLHGT